MLKTIVLVVLCLCATTSISESVWARINNENSDPSIFIDRRSGRKEINGMRRVWLMYDRTKPTITNNQKEYSTKVLFYINCASSTFGMKSMYGYSKSMGDGEVVFSNSKEDFQVKMADTVPDSTAEVVATIVCANPPQ